MLEIPVAGRARVRSVQALDGGTPLGFRKVKGKLFISLPADIPGADYVVKVTLR